MKTLVLYARALREVCAFWPHIGAVLGLGLLTIPLSLLMPYPMKLVVDHAFGGLPLPSWLAGVIGTADAAAILTYAVIMGMSLAFLQAVWGVGDWHLREWIAARMMLAFRAKLFHHGFGLPLINDEKGTWDAINRINEDAPSIVWTALYGFIPVILSVVSLASMLAVTAMIAPMIALSAFLTGIPLLFFAHSSQTRLRRRWHEVREAESASLAIIQEAYGAQHIVTTFCQEDRERSRFVSASLRAIGRKMAVMWAEGLISIVSSLTVACGATMILYLGARDVLSGSMTVGDLLLVLGYVGQIYGPIQHIGSHITGQQRALVSAERAFSLLDRSPTVTDRPHAQAVERAVGQISFSGVGFSYGDRRVLQDVSFDVPAGACVGVVGHTGSGKTTMINLLIRQFDPCEGVIRMDGIDLRDCRLSNLRSQFSVVSQEPILFSTTITENIAYGRPGASMEEVVAAAEAANAHGFISGLPDGYDTKVGERGLTLSGGERQRIALARAFLKNAPLLILDEPTSAIDTATEASIVSAIERLMRGRTTFMIAHRVSTLRSADMILRVDQGRVSVERSLTGDDQAAA